MIPRAILVVLLRVCSVRCTAVLNMSDVEIIKKCSTPVGHNVELLWRDDLGVSFSRQIMFNESGN